MRDSEIRFIRQLGYSTHPTRELYAALMLQPRIVGGVLVLGTLFQSRWLFVMLSAALWLSALVPTYNPFDAIYNHLIANRRGLTPLGAAPNPRRFAAGLAGAVVLGIVVAFLLGATITAWALEGLLICAVAAVVFGSNCAGAALYHRLRRQSPTEAGFTPTPHTRRS